MSLGGDPVQAWTRLRAAYEEREAEARRRHATGQKVVGYLSANVPEELILAAGAFPVRLSGDPREETPLGNQYMEDFFDGEIRSLFHRALSGHFDFVDLLVIPRTSEGMLQLYYFLQQMPRWEPERRLPPLYLFDLLQTNHWLTGRYVRGRIEDFKHHLEQMAAKAIDEWKISKAIEVCNRNRLLLQELNGRRRQNPAALSGGEMLRAMGASYFIDKVECAGLLEMALRASSSQRGGVRVMVKGSPQDSAGFYDLLENLDATVVADDHGWGERNFAHLVRTGVDPLEALTEHYHLHSPSARQYPQATQDAAFLDLVRSAGVEAVIFYIEENDDTLGWDYPAQKAALETRNIPSLYLTRQSYRRPDRSAQRVTLESFLREVRQ